jgi:Right handed beta helix region
MNRRLVTALLAITLGPLANAASATILRVEKDGTGDYAVIQDALDAAAPGDTVLVGPGRFDTFRLRNSTVDNFAFQGIIHITTDDLVVLGAGSGQMVIGPVVHTDAIGVLGTGGVTMDGGATVVVSGFYFENVRWPATIRSSRSVMENCTFARANSQFSAWVLNGTDVIIRNCVFSDANGIVTGSGGVQRLLIEGCQFDDDTLRGNAVVIGNGAINCTVRRCDFTRGGGGTPHHSSSGVRADS